MIDGQDYNKTADWWIFGIILYEFVYGVPPFTSDKGIYDLKEKIKTAQIKFPVQFEVSDPLRDLIGRLLAKDPRLRLGDVRDGSAVKEHKWFEGFEWKKLIDRKLTAPIIPEIEHATDVRNFDSWVYKGEVGFGKMEESDLEVLRKAGDVWEKFNEVKPKEGEHVWL